MIQAYNYTNENNVNIKFKIFLRSYQESVLNIFFLLNLNYFLRLEVFLPFQLFLRYF